MTVSELVIEPLLTFVSELELNQKVKETWINLNQNV